jgi:hypothetical protein
VVRWSLVRAGKFGKCFIALLIVKAVIDKLKKRTFLKKGIL